MNARTLRQIAGVASSLQAGATVAAGKTAIVLIDYQNEYREGPLALPDEAAASSAARQLRAWAARVGIAVIHVLHQAPAGAPFFAEASPGAAPLLPGWPRRPAKRPSSSICPRPSPAPVWPMHCKRTASIPC